MPDPAVKASPSLEATIRHRIGTLSLDVRVELRDPWTVLFGPSGAGKSTLLRILAGLIRPDQATLTLHRSEPRTLIDTNHRVFIPPGQRGIGFLTQAPNLFPHLSVAANVAFGLHRLLRAERQSRVAAMLRLFRAEQFADRMPDSLSGGERQRVALARALAPGPKLLLLDEPFAALDATLKSAILADLLPWLSDRNIPALYVSHDLAEAFETGSEVISIREGKITAQGPAKEVLAEERLQLLQRLSL